MREREKNKIRDMVTKRIIPIIAHIANPSGPSSLNWTWTTRRGGYNKIKAQQIDRYMNKSPKYHKTSQGEKNTTADRSNSKEKQA
jgi:hypothetical protein